MKIERIAAVFEIIGVVGAIVTGLLGNTMAAIVMIGLVIVVATGYFIWKIVSLTKENKSLKATLARKPSPTNIRKYFDDPIWISSTRKNRQLIPADFIQWDQCTILLWVYIPPQGEGLRDSNKNRCLWSHTTGHTETWANFNGFTLRHNETQRWHFSFSNNQANYAPHGILIDDGLDPGWHHFMLLWNKLQPELRLLIDKGIHGTARLGTFLSYWPERNAENVTVGAWEDGNPGTYCETKLLSLWICNQYLAIEDDLVRIHYSRATQPHGGDNDT